MSGEFCSGEWRAASHRGKRLRMKTLCGACVVLLFAASAGRDGTSIAIVNERAISKRKVVDFLMESHGLEALQQLMLLELAKQETRRLGLEVTEADVEREYQRALDRIAAAANISGGSLTQENKERALKTILGERGLSLPEFKLGMERNAHLRRVIEQTFEVDDATLREEFARTYGEKVQVRHIQANDTATLQAALDRLARGDDFADVASALSQNDETAARGGLMSPFAFTDEYVPAAMREVAFSLKPGEMSNPVKTGNYIHILKLVRRIPPEDAQFGAVRDAVERKLRERVIPELMEDLITKLYRDAEIRVLDRRLRRELEELLEENQGLTPGRIAP